MEQFGPTPNKVSLNHWLSLLKLLLFSAVWFSTQSFANNPIVSHVYTADPSAHVFNNRVYVVTTHDQDGQTDYGSLVDYHLFSSDDMANWQDHGVIWNSQRDTSWASLAYAPDMIERNERYYLYFPNGANSIGVAVADRPEGPYSDPLGRPLVDRNTPNANVNWLFDPAVFIDDNGQAYLYFGGGDNKGNNARVIRLNNDMISTSGSAISINVPNFFEALSMNKRNGTYYLTYSADGSKGFAIEQMTSSSPTGGFTHRGTVLPNPWENNNNNNHQSIVQFKNQWYIFYHNRAVANARGASTYQRSINVDRLYFNSDGSIQRVNAGPAGVPQIKYVDAFAVNQAEMFDQESGIETEQASEGTQNLMMGGGEWIKISGLDFGADGATGMKARIATEISSSLDIVLDNLNNTPHATMQINPTGGWQTYNTQSVSFRKITGVHDVYLRCTGYHNLNWYQFTRSGGTTPPPPSGGQKFLGNIVDSSNLNFAKYWNQVTPENSGKWQSVEPSRDSYNWSKLDQAYNFAKANGFPFKLHTFVWGNQEPNWLGGISNSARAQEVEELIRDTCARYPDLDMIDVVNEPLHAPSNARWGLGGDGSTGWDWVVRSFQLARQYCPNAKLLLNDYGIINDRNAATRYRGIIDVLKARGLIDGIGLQSHSFSLLNYSASTLKGNLDYLAQTGLPIYISEWDIDANDQTQLQQFQQKFPTVWEHPAVAGVTIWGYVQGLTWMDNSGLMYSNGSERPALTWLKGYAAKSAPPQVPGSGVTVKASGVSGGEHINLRIGGKAVADWTLTTSPTDYVYTGTASGDIQVEFDNDDSGKDVILDYIIVNNEVRQAEDMEYNTATYDGSCGGGSYSEIMHCNGVIGFGNTYDCFSGDCTDTEPQPQPEPEPVPQPQPDPCAGLGGFSLWWCRIVYGS